jgi:hypothetical protein
MSNRRLLFVLLAAILVPAPLAAGQIDVQGKKIVVRLARPLTAMLHDDEIRSVLSGHRLVFDNHFIESDTVLLRSPDLGGCPSIESFLADGRWRQFVCGIVATEYRGTWSVKDRKVCVQVNRSNENCRSVWRTNSPSKLILTSNLVVDEFAPYKIEDIPNGS